MTLSETPGLLKRFRRTPWRFQETFHTPLKSLQPFVASIVGAHAPLKTAALTFEQVVFDPKHLIALLSSHSIELRYERGWTITADDPEEVEALLHAGLSDWVDFAFVPTPKPFVIYADHDEYTTLYANTKSNLNRVSGALSSRGFEKVSDYERNL